MTTNSNSKAITKAPSEEQLALLQGEFPIEQGFTRKFLPRLGLVSQDKTEEKKDPKTGKKKIELITEAGTFFTDKQDPEEKDDNGNPAWNHLEIGNEIEGIVVFRRKQLKYFNKETKEFTSSPIYDNDEDVVPLFLNKKEIHRGTPKDLQALEEYVYEEEGKQKTRLEQNYVLYVLYEGELHEMSLRGSSMYAFKTYARKNIANTVVTKFNSEPKENGNVKWNQMTFEVARALNAGEVDEVLEKIAEIKQGIAEEKAFFANKATDDAASTAALDKF